MQSETGYYFTHLLSAVYFVENIDPKNLKIDPELFWKLYNQEEVKEDTPTPNQQAPAGSPPNSSGKAEDDPSNIRLQQVGGPCLETPESSVSPRHAQY